MVFFTINVVFEKTVEVNSDLFLSSNLSSCSQATMKSGRENEEMVRA